MSRVSYDYFDEKENYPSFPESREYCLFNVSRYDFSKYAINPILVNI